MLDEEEQEDLRSAALQKVKRGTEVLEQKDVKQL